MDSHTLLDVQIKIGLKMEWYYNTNIVKLGTASDLRNSPLSADSTECSGNKLHWEIITLGTADHGNWSDVF